jgi:glucose-6-phosphate isomerase
MTAAAFATSLTLVPHTLDAAVDQAARELTERRFVDALFTRQPTAWSADAAVQRTIANRLGWLRSPEAMEPELPRLRAFADEVRREGFTDIVLLGMGGSSLAPEVLRAVGRVREGFPRFTMIDAVNPDHLRGVATDPHHTLVVLASKSGSTIEPNVLAAYFRQRLVDAGVTRWERHFVAITDPGTALDTRAVSEGFRDVFRNPPDIGGRYSAVSFFGLVPAALMGLDVAELVRDARAMLEAARDGEPRGNPAIGLGLLAGAAAREGRDKLTLLLPPALEPFGLWVEQLVAESTGKQGAGIVPVAGEPPGPPEDYGADRLFVRVRVHDATNADDADRLTRELNAIGAPSAEIVVQDVTRLGAEFVRWELATATAAALMGINPFDEPNVQQAKDATRNLLETFKNEGRLPVPEPDAEIDHAAMTLSTAARRGLGSRDITRFLTLLGSGDYLGILAYLPESPEIDAVVRRFRSAVRATTRVATTFGYGPRYLHSTGQLHKGGANNGVFLLVTAPGQDVAVPGEPFSFGILELAQALGDLTSLDEAGRRALHVHLPRPQGDTLQRMLERLLEGRS